MGCFNVNCMITNLPIILGEECYGIILNLRTYINNKLYPFHSKELAMSHSFSPTRVFSPEPVIISGKYNEYGAMEETSGLDEYLKEKGMTEEEFWDTAHRGEDTFVVSFIRKEVLDKILNGYDKDVWDRYDEVNSKGIYTSFRKKAKEDIDDYFEKAKIIYEERYKDIEAYTKLSEERQIELFKMEDDANRILSTRGFDDGVFDIRVYDLPKYLTKEIAFKFKILHNFLDDVAIDYKVSKLGKQLEELGSYELLSDAFEDGINGYREYIKRYE